MNEASADARCCHSDIAERADDACTGNDLPAACGHATRSKAGAAMIHAGHLAPGWLELRAGEAQSRWGGRTRDRRPFLKG